MNGARPIRASGPRRSAASACCRWPGRSSRTNCRTGSSAACAAGLRADPAAVQRLAERVEGNLLAAAQEIDKLALLADGQPLDVERMESLVADAARYDVFRLVEATFSGQPPASCMLAGLRGEGEAVAALMPIVIRELLAGAGLARVQARGGNLAAEMKSRGIWESRQAPCALQRHPEGKRWGTLRGRSRAGRPHRQGAGRRRCLAGAGAPAGGRGRTACRAPAGAGLSDEPADLLRGTFDPVHLGHLAIARAARDELQVAVRMLPAGDPPHRAVPGATAEQRCTMLSLAIGDEPGLLLDRRELDRATRYPGRPSYTVDTLRELRGELGPSRPLAWLVGADSLLGLSGWHEWEAPGWPTSWWPSGRAARCRRRSTVNWACPGALGRQRTGPVRQPGRAHPAPAPPAARGIGQRRALADRRRWPLARPAAAGCRGLRRCTRAVPPGHSVNGAAVPSPYNRPTFIESIHFEQPDPAPDHQGRSAQPPPSVPELLASVRQATEDLKAKDLVEIDVRGRSSVADYMIVVSGTSTRHVKSIADEVVRLPRTST